MEYQNIKNLLDNTPNHLSKSRAKNRVEINDELYRTHKTGSQIKFKTSMIMLNVKCQ